MARRLGNGRNLVPEVPFPGISGNRDNYNVFAKGLIEMTISLRVFLVTDTFR